MARRWGLVLAALMMLGAGAGAGCGSVDPTRSPVDGEAPSFCRAYARLAAADAGTSQDDLDDYRRELAYVGTPRGVPTAARRGFEYVIDSDHTFADGAAFAALAQRQDPIGQDALALKVYAQQIC
ncbi:MAG: hypothetical protein NTV23_00685 [Propionibacteriales bacterium]|nr:hypothetical protein [Propionibacteriales bacterium]